MMAQDPSVVQLSKHDGVETSNEYNTFDALENSNRSVDNASVIEREDKHEGRVVQVSTDRHEDHLMSAIALSRNDATIADGIIVVKNRTFRVHRLVVSAFSKVLSKAFSNEPSHVVFVDYMEADIMAVILDWMYGNMALLKESFLVSFVKAVRDLDIEMLQTPGLLQLEKALLASSIPELSDTKQDETVPFTISPSLSVTVMKAVDEKKIDVKYNENTSSRNFPDRQDAYKIITTGKSSEIRNKEKTHCCHCCKKACEETKGKKESREIKGKEEALQDDYVRQTLKKKLEKLGTKVSTSGGMFRSFADIPAWIFSSRGISLAPAKKPLKASTPKKHSPFSLESKSPALSSPLVHDNDDPIIIESLPPKLPLNNARRNLQSVLQTPSRQQQYNHYNEGERKLVGGTSLNKLRTSPYPASINASNRGFRGRGYVGVQTQQRPVHIPPSNDAPRAQKLSKEKTSNTINVSSLPQSRPQSIPITTPSVKRGGILAKRRRPKTCLYSGSKSVVYMGDGGTPLKSKPLEQDTSKNLVPSEREEHVVITDTGITLTLPDSAAEVLSGSTILQYLSDSDKAGLKNLEHSATNNLQKSEGTSEIPTELQDQLKEASPNSLQLESCTTPKDEMSKSSDIESSRIHDDLNNLSDKISAFEGFDKTENIVQTSDTSQPVVLMKRLQETSGNNTSREAEEDLSLKEDLKSVNSSDNFKGPDVAEGTQLKSSMKKKTRKHKCRPKKRHLCTVCKKIFSNNISLVLHMRMHTGEKAYHCSSCEYRSEFIVKIKSHVSCKHGRKLVDSEKKCVDAPSIDPSQAVVRPAKRKKDSDEMKVKIDSEVSNKEKEKDNQIQSESPQSIGDMKSGEVKEETEDERSKNISEDKDEDKRELTNKDGNNEMGDDEVNDEK